MIAVRRAARIGGVLVSVAWSIPLVGHLIGGDEVEAERADSGDEGVVLTVLVLTAIAGAILAFRNERRGGTLLVVVGVALSVFAVVTAGRNHWLAVLVAGVPWLVVGTLFLAASRARSADPG